MALRSVGKKAYGDMVRKVGKAKLKAIVRARQGLGEAKEARQALPPPGALRTLSRSSGDREDTQSAPIQEWRL
jgi:hypothetical protein